MNQPARSGCPWWMKLLLIVSLAVNLAVLGIVIGHSLRQPEHGARSTRAVDWIIEIVPEERRAFAIAHFAEARDQIAAAYDARAREIEPVLAAIRAEPYDPAALDSALDEMLDRRSGARAIVRERLISLLAEFTPAERAVFAERLAERLNGRSG